MKWKLAVSANWTRDRQLGIHGRARLPSPLTTLLEHADDTDPDAHPGVDRAQRRITREVAERRDLRLVCGSVRDATVVVAPVTDEVETRCWGSMVSVRSTTLQPWSRVPPGDRVNVRPTVLTLPVYRRRLMTHGSPAMAISRVTTAAPTRASSHSGRRTPTGPVPLPSTKPGTRLGPSISNASVGASSLHGCRSAHGMGSMIGLWTGRRGSGSRPIRIGPGPPGRAGRTGTVSRVGTMPGPGEVWPTARGRSVP